jgi:hypothetical protein
MTALEDAALAVAKKYPNFNAAQKAKNPSYFDAHPCGALATGHAELQGYGVTMIQGKWPKAVENASGDLECPTLLFFQKLKGDQDCWKIIGMGYTRQYASKKTQRPPDDFEGIAASDWWIHEAGYHHSPGDGGFTCATDDDLKKSARDAGKRIDRAGLCGIAEEDLKTREFRLDKKHGRYWTVHVWFEPGTGLPRIALTDPWKRQSGKAVCVPARAFFKQDA